MVSPLWSILVPMLCGSVAARRVRDRPPHVVLLAADDLGWNDVSWHNPDIKSPYINKLAKGGVKLEQYAVYMTCSPTRTSLMTGRIPYHTGVHKPINVKPQAVNMKHKMIPEVLSTVGYESHLVGKWHLGYFQPQHLPAGRGFASSLGYLGGAEQYFSHDQTCKLDNSSQIVALDFCETLPTENGSASIAPQPQFKGEYSTNVLVDRAATIISDYVSRDSNTSLFIYMAFQSVHGPCEAPQSFIDKYPATMQEGRRTFSGMVSALDEATQNLTSVLTTAGLWEDTLLIFTTDNGGNLKQNGNNFPLRGAKFSLWEGGTRGVGFVYSASDALIPKGMRGTSISSITHAADWFATILDAAGHVDALPTSAIDSKSMWPLLTGTATNGSGRDTLVHGAYGKSGKLTFGKIRWQQYNYYYGYPGLDDWTRVAPLPPDHGVGETVCSNGCLFDVLSDPNERTDLVNTSSDIASKLHDALAAALNDCPDDCSTDDQKGTYSSNWECESFLRWGTFGPMFPDSPKL